MLAALSSKYTRMMARCTTIMARVAIAATLMLLAAPLDAGVGPEPDGTTPEDPRDFSGVLTPKPTTTGSPAALAMRATSGATSPASASAAPVMPVIET